MSSSLLGVRRGLMALLLALLLLAPVAAEECLHCPDCGQDYPRAPRFCPKDGRKLLVREVPTRRCPKCERSFRHGERFCPEDGRKLEIVKPVERRCDQCGRVFVGSETFCPYDGRRLAAKGDREVETTPPRREPGSGKTDKARGATEIPAPPAINPKPKSGAVVTEPEAPSADRTLKFVSTPSDTATMPFRLARAGPVEAVVDFAGGGEVIAYLYVKGQVKPLAEQAGPSPVILKADVSPAVISLSEEFEIWIVHKDGATAVGELRLKAALQSEGAREPTLDAPPKAPRPGTTPSDGTDKGDKADDGEAAKPPADTPIGTGESFESRPFKLEPGGTIFEEVKVTHLGRLQIRIVFPAGKRLAAVLSDRTGRERVAVGQGNSPIVLYHQVTPKLKTFRLLVTSFDKTAVKGAVKISLPSAAKSAGDAEETDKPDKNAKSGE